MTRKLGILRSIIHIMVTTQKWITTIGREILYFIQFLEFLKGFLISGGLCNFQSVEFHCLGQRPALADDGNVSGLDVPEARGQVDGHILVPFLKPIVFLNVVEVVPEEKWFLKKGLHRHQRGGLACGWRWSCSSWAWSQCQTKCDLWWRRFRWKGIFCRCSYLLEPDITRD